MAAELRWINKGASCSYKGYPTIRLRDDLADKILPTSQIRSDDVPESWVDLTTNTDDSLDSKGALGYFRILTTNLDSKGSPCPAERMISGRLLQVDLPGLGMTEVLAAPYEGPRPASCDGRLAVTPVAQLQKGE
jgi:hypothetical protein